MRRSRSFLCAVIAVILFIGGSLGNEPRAFAQMGCAGRTPQKDIDNLKLTLKEMSTDDPAVMDRHIKELTAIVEHWRLATPGEENAATRLYEDALEFWREKKAHHELGDMVEVRAGGRWVTFLKSKLGEAEKPIVGTWNWWNGYTVTFNENGGASYSGSSLVKSGVGRWQNTGGDTYHVHWLQSKTDDYFTLSGDGKKLEGKYDGKPGVSTRRCYSNETR